MARGPIRQQRVEEEKIETYTPPFSYDIPEEVKEHFESKGLHLRWIRVLVDGRDDYKNVADRRREGYEPVSITELPAHVRDLFETKSFGNAVSKYAEIAMVGDLALFKIPKAKSVARQRYYENLAYQNERAVSQNLGRDTKLNKILPIHNESTTTVRVGSRKQHAPDEFGGTLKSTTIDDSDDAE